VVAAALLLMPRVTATDVSFAGAPATRSTGIGLIKLGAGRLPASAHRSRATKFSVVVVGQSGARRAARLPGRSLLYACGVNVPGPTAGWSGSCGVSWATASANNWILKDASGSYVGYGNGYSYLADIGNSAYQQAWIAAMSSILAAD